MPVNVELPLEGESAPPAPVRPREHIGWIDGVRGFAALYIVVGHIIVHLPMRKSGIEGALKSLAIFGHGAVDTFIVLSGFCLALPVVRNGGILRGGPKRFFQRRALRILPTYYLALAFSLLLDYTIIGAKTGTHWDTSLPVTKAGILAHLALIQDFSYAWYSKINHAMWSISVEWHIYFLFPLLIVLMRRNLNAVLLGTIAISYSVWAALIKTPINTKPWGCSPYYVGLFALGIFGCEYVFGDRSERPLDAVKMKWGLAIATVAAMGLTAAKAPLQFVSLIFGIAATLMLVGVGRGQFDWLKKILSVKLLDGCGRMGYSLYLLHAPLIQVLYQYVVRPLHLGNFKSTLLLLALSPMIVAISYLGFLVIEKPFVRMLAARKG
jgi:peptidoglycan/LPS O-acetylase OafA/YrhL